MSLTVGFKSELTLPPGVFDFVGTSMVGNLNELPGAPLTPGNNAVGSRLVQTDQPVQFSFRWNVNGIMTHAFNPAVLWQVEILFERYGPGEFNIGPVGSIVLPFGSGTLSGTTTTFPGILAPGSTTINIPPSTVPAGVYDIVAVIRLVHPGTLLPCFLAAFAEFGKIQFYREHV